MPFEGDLKREYMRTYITPYMREYVKKHPKKVWTYHRNAVYRRAIATGRLPTQRSIDKYGFTPSEIGSIAQHMSSGILTDPEPFMNTSVLTHVS